MSRCTICERNVRSARAEEKENGADPGQPDRNGRLVSFSEEERKRRSELAKRLHAEGRFGGSVVGARGGRAVNRHRITDAVLDHFRQPDKQDMVINALERALKGKNKHLGLAAYRELRTTEEKAIERERADRGGAVDPHAMTDDALEEFVAQGIEAIIARGELPDIVLGDDAVQDVS